MLFSTLGLPQDWFYGGDSFGVTYADIYAGGEMVFASVGTSHESSTPLSAIETERWGQTNSCDQLSLSTICLGPAQGYYYPYPGIVAADLAFSADFGPAGTAAPEPSSVAMLSIACLAYVAKRRILALRRRIPARAKS